MVACEGHPLLVPRVRRYLDHELNLRETQQAAWRRHWTVETLAALEAHLAGHQDTGRFCHGDAPSLADICMVGHVTVAITQADRPFALADREAHFRNRDGAAGICQGASAGAAGYAGGDAGEGLSERRFFLPLSPCGRGWTRCAASWPGEGLPQQMCLPIETPHPALRATFSHKGRREEEHTVSRSRGAWRPRFADRWLPRKSRGRREDRVRAAPAVSCAIGTGKNAHEHTGSAEAIRPSLRSGFTAYTCSPR